MIPLRFSGELVALQSSFCSRFRPPAGQAPQQEVGCCRMTCMTRVQGTCSSLHSGGQESAAGTDGLPCPLLAGERHYRVRRSPGVFPFPRSPSSFPHCLPVVLSPSNLLFAV